MTFEEWYAKTQPNVNKTTFKKYPSDGKFILNHVQIACDAWQASREAAIDECAAQCLKERDMFLSEKYAVNQPSSSYAERFACGILHDAILQLKDK